VTAEAVRVAAPFQATGKQLALHRLWRDPATRVVTIGGAIRSGKTQAAGRLLVETAVERPATYLVARSTYRELEDSTKKAMLFGDGSMPPLIPVELIPTGGYRASDNVIRLRTGAEVLFRSLEETNVGKLLNLTLGGVFVDQIEELDGGDAGERIFDTLLGRLSDPRGPRKLLAVANPAGLTHWVYRRLVEEETGDRDARYVHVSLSDNRAHLPADYVRAMEATRETRPAWYRTYVLGEWGAFEGMAFPDFEEAIHVVRPFEIPAHWRYFESMDFGANHPTAWHAWTADEDGNLVVASEYYSPGLASKHAAEILGRRARFASKSRDYVYCHSDPSMWNEYGLTSKRAVPASIATELNEHGLHGLVRANNDRAAGYLRLRELIEVDPGRVPPPWAQIRDGVEGAPRLFVFSTCRELVKQLRSAPIAVTGPEAAEAVDRQWEGEQGHAVASVRYGAISWPRPSAPLEEQPPDDPRAAFLWMIERKREKDLAEPWSRKHRRHEWV
jgi:hypothetical protein